MSGSVVLQTLLEPIIKFFNVQQVVKIGQVEVYFQSQIAPRHCVSPPSNRLIYETLKEFQWYRRSKRPSEEITDGRTIFYKWLLLYPEYHYTAYSIKYIHYSVLRDLLGYFHKLLLYHVTHCRIHPVCFPRCQWINAKENGERDRSLTHNNAYT